MVNPDADKPPPPPVAPFSSYLVSDSDFVYDASTGAYVLVASVLERKVLDASVLVSYVVDASVF